MAENDTEQPGSLLPGSSVASSRRRQRSPGPSFAERGLGKRPRRNLQHRASRLEALRRRWKRALQRTKGRWVLVQFGLVLAEASLLAIWTTIPDRNLLEITLTVLLALAGLAFGANLQWRVLRVVRQPIAAPPPWLGAATLGVFVLFYLAVTTLLDPAIAPSISNDIDQTNQGWTSLLQTMRTLLIGALHLCLLIALLPLGVEASTCGPRAPWGRRGSAVLRRRSFWLTAVTIGLFTWSFSSSLLSFRPSLSAALLNVLGLVKLTLIALMNLGALCFLLSFCSTYLRDLERAEQTSVQR